MQKSWPNIEGSSCCTAHRERLVSIILLTQVVSRSANIRNSPFSWSVHEIFCQVCELFPEPFDFPELLPLRSSLLWPDVRPVRRQSNILPTLMIGGSRGNASELRRRTRSLSAVCSCLVSLLDGCEYCSGCALVMDQPRSAATHFSKWIGETGLILYAFVVDPVVVVTTTRSESART